jgi:hypothetical protein
MTRTAGRGFTVSLMADDDLFREMVEKAEDAAPANLSFLRPEEASEEEAAVHIQQQLLKAGYSAVPDDYAQELVRQAWAEIGKGQ